MQRLGDIDDEDDSLKEEEYVYDETTGGMVPAEKTEDGHLKKIMRWIGVGSLSEILASDSVKNRATSWLSDCKSIRLRHRHRPSQKRLGLGHVCDWPIAGVVEVIDSFDLKRFFRGMEEEGWLWDDSGASTGLKASLAVAELSSTPPSFDFDLLASTSPNASASASAAGGGSGGGSAHPPRIEFPAVDGVSLLGGGAFEPLGGGGGGGGDRFRLTRIPRSYTDLFRMLPNQAGSTALCLTCGLYLDSKGKGMCTEHAKRCGPVFFIVQQVKLILICGPRAVYLPCPYVDENRETPQYRGKPLYLDEERMKMIKKHYFSHTAREKVVNERQVLQNVIRMNYY